MESTMESCVPPGFRFHPTDEELVGYYLKKKVASQKIDLDVIREVDLYRIEPWDIQERCRIGYEEQNEWYFFSHKDKKYPTGTRTNRATMAGFWKATGRDKAVYDKAKLIGMRKTLVFYKGRAPNGQKTDWIMHEYRLETEENAPPQASKAHLLIIFITHPLIRSTDSTHLLAYMYYSVLLSSSRLLQEEGWVVCRAFKKRITTQNKSIEGWDSAYFYDDQPSSMSTVVDSIDYVSRNPNSSNFLSQNFLCKQELEADNLSFINSDHDPFVQLPQLESPSLPLIKRPTPSISLISENNEEDDQQIRGYYNNNDNNNNHNQLKVTDWRSLDKFVASQLSQEDRYDESSNHILHGMSSFGHQKVIDNSDMAPLPLYLQSDYAEEGSKINGFFSSSSNSDDCDNIGICIFENQRGFS
ncbi:hypothetical protein RHMOL_Rhmol10G0303700 [Rhododendron molle]|uniref:Uncharacterized protein n=1 Tax=Rhododendron molle TaxID=49168 RepID=A0ACC0M9F8_RHOML|nr:hypothetical protein RHMOL_Rhmol10G0303700 [Rhododendron molle]